MLSKESQEFIHKSIVEAPEYITIKDEFLRDRFMTVSKATDIIENITGWRSEVYAIAILHNIVYCDNGENDLHIFTN